MHCVAAAAHSVDQLAAVRPVDLGAQPRDVRLDYAGLRLEMEAPHPLEQHRARQHAALVAHQHLEQAELARLQIDHIRAARHLAQINVSANNLSENEFEVILSVEGKAENAGKVMFSFDLAYAGVFRIVNVPKENLHPLVMIECPRLLFPFAREIIATSVRDGGFPPLMLDPVDFVGLYRQNMERQAAEQAASGVKPS